MSSYAQPTPGVQQQQQQQRRESQRSVLVQRLLSQTASLPAFINDLITVQAVVVAGTEAAAFSIEASEQPEQFGLKTLAHIRPDDSSPEIRQAALNAFMELVKPCVQQGRDGAIQIDNQEETPEPQFCLVTVLRSEGNVVAVSAVITRCRDTERAQQRLVSMQLVAGYFELFGLRRSVEQARQVALSHQNVLQLATAVGTSSTFSASSANLCNELAARAKAARVSLGWVQGTKVKLKAMSHTEEFDKKQELAVQVVRVMEESLDQEEVVVHNPAGEKGQAVTREASALSRMTGGHTIVTLPLRREEEIHGLLTLEFAPEDSPSSQMMTSLAVAADLLSPQLFDRHANDRWLITKTGIAIREVWKKTIGPKYTLAKTIIGAFLLLAAFLVLYRPMFYVTAPFTFVPVEQRSLHAPFDGFLRDVHVRPGERVSAGQLLAEMNTYELELKHNEAEARYRQALLEEQKARAEASRDRADPAREAAAFIAYQQQLEARAQVEFFAEQMRRARLVAPFDGEVVSGDLMDKRGAPVRSADPLIVVARIEPLRVEINVRERDIQYLGNAVGRPGKIATTSLPDARFPVTVERVVPLGNAEGGANVFKVYANPDHAADSWLPGMQGEAKIEVERKPLIWIWTHRLVDFVKLKLWTLPI